MRPTRHYNRPRSISEAAVVFSGLLSRPRRRLCRAGFVAPLAWHLINQASAGVGGGATHALGRFYRRADCAPRFPQVTNCASEIIQKTPGIAPALWCDAHVTGAHFSRGEAAMRHLSRGILIGLSTGTRTIWYHITIVGAEGGYNEAFPRKQGWHRLAVVVFPGEVRTPYFCLLCVRHYITSGADFVYLPEAYYFYATFISAIASGKCLENVCHVIAIA